MSNRFRSILFLAAALLVVAEPPTYASILRVRQQAPGPTYDGQTWQTAFLSIADAVAAAALGDEIWVAEGTYVHPDIDVEQDMSFYGGFAGTETERSQRDPASHASIVQEDRSNYGAIAFQGSVGPATVVDGFTFTTYIGIFCNATAPTIIHNTFRDGVGAINNWSGSPRILYNTISSMGYLGIGSGGGDPIVQGNYFTGTKSGYFHSSGLGGSGSAVLVGNVFVGVYPAIDIEQGACYIGDNLVTGGGVVVRSSPSTIVNNTIVGPGGGLGIPGATLGSIVANNVVAFNLYGIAAAVASPTSDSTVLFNNCVYGNTLEDYFNVKDATGFQGNISVDPQLVSRNGDMHLAATSPLIDAGDDAYVQYGDTDVAGSPRIQGARVDIGAYEFGGGAFTLGDVAGALRLWGGLSVATPDLAARLGIEPGNGVDLRDAVRLARKAAGLDPNP